MTIPALLFVALVLGCAWSWVEGGRARAKRIQAAKDRLERARVNAMWNRIVRDQNLPPSLRASVNARKAQEARAKQALIRDGIRRSEA